MKDKFRLPRTDTPQFRVGFGGNCYVWCGRRQPVEDIARAIGKSPRAVYFRADFGVWAIRVRDHRQKALLKGLFARQWGQPQFVLGAEAVSRKTANPYKEE